MPLVKAKAIVDVLIDPPEVASAIRQHIYHIYGVLDDAGCDWYTDDDGQVYFGADPKWKAYPKDPQLAALVDAANILTIGHALKMPEYETWHSLVSSGELSGYSRFSGTEIDREIVEKEKCERCDGSLEYIGMQSNTGDSYRAFARCRSCDAVHEF